MTDEQAAKRLVDTWYRSTMAGNGNYAIGHSEEEWTLLEQAIATALAARERAVWLEAAEMIEEYKSTGGTTSPGQATICRLAARFRKQAEVVKP